MAKSKQVKFEVGQLVKFHNRAGQVSRIAKNGAVYVIVIGETQGEPQGETQGEELRVKKADLQLIEESEAQQEIELADAAQEIEEIEPIESIESTAAAFSLESAGGSQSLAEATYALRELTFSVTRHSILTAFIDVALNKNIPGYHYQVASNLKNLMAEAFDPVHDSVGYARINDWTMAALELVVKNKAGVANMLSQPIEAAPIKIDRVTKLGMWIDYRMRRAGQQVNDMTSAHDSCYTYDVLGKKLEAYTFVVVEVAAAPSGGQAKVKFIKDPLGYYTKHLTAQSAISARQQHGKRVHRKSPDWHIYCGIVPILKTGLSMQAAIDGTLAIVMGSLKGIK